MLLFLFGGVIVPPNPTGETVLMPAKAGGGWFSRKKFEEFQAEEEALRAKERKRLELEREKELKRAFAEFRSPADKRIAELLEQANAAASKVAQLPFGSPNMPSVQDYTAHARHAQEMAQDEDDAEALLLLNH